MFPPTLGKRKHAFANRIGNNICRRQIRVVCGLFFTCPWSYQPAVEEAPSNRVVEDESPLAVHRLHHVFHGDGNVGVRARRVLVPLLPFNQEVSKRACSPALRDGQSLVVPAWNVSTQ